MIKKTKKAKENPEEENTRETENKEQDKSQVDQVTAGVKEEEQNEDAVRDVEDEDVSRRSPNVVNMPLAAQRPLIRQDTVDSQSGPGTSSIPHKQQSQQLIQDDEKTPDKESPKGLLIRAFVFVVKTFLSCLNSFCITIRIKTILLS